MSEAILEDVLLGNDDQPTEEPVEEEVVNEPKVEEKEDETTTSETPEEVTEKKAKQDWTYHQAMDERSKRQVSEARVKELEAKLNQPKPEDRPDIFDDQKGFTESLTKEFDGKLSNMMANQSEFHVRREFDDVDEKLKIYDEISKNNPALLAQVQDSVSPWYEMYSIATSHQELEEMKDIDGYKAKIRAEVEADVRKEIETGQEQDDKKRDSITPSLASKRSTGGTNQTVDQTLEEILGR